MAARTLIGAKALASAKHPVTLSPNPGCTAYQKMSFGTSLTRSEQLALNGRAALRDFFNGEVDKLCFHLRGFWRALVN